MTWSIPITLSTPLLLPGVRFLMMLTGFRVRWVKSQCTKFLHNYYKHLWLYGMYMCGGVHQCSALIKSKCTPLAHQPIDIVPCGSFMTYLIQAAILNPTHPYIESTTIPSDNVYISLHTHRLSPSSTHSHCLQYTPINWKIIHVHWKVNNFKFACS